MLALAVLRDLPWMHDALCAEPHYNPAAWFPTNSQDLSAAKTVCQQCDVQGECLAYAIREDIRDGIWGGATPAERKPNRRAGRAPTHALSIISLGSPRN